MKKTFNEQDINNVIVFFSKTPFPCTDNVTLAYANYAEQLPEFEGANIIDGMGNDVYIGHIPGAREFLAQQISRYIKWTRLFTKTF